METKKICEEGREEEDYMHCMCYYENHDSCCYCTSMHLKHDDNDDD